MKLRLLVRLRAARTCSIAVLAMTAGALDASGQNPGAQPSSAATDWSGVEQALRRKGAANPGGVIRFSFPRSDLSVTVGGVALKPALALGSWVAFKELGAGQTMAMGDLVLTEDEVSPVMAALQAGGVERGHEG